MSRQKVSDDKRQRTAQACDYCKRRKQKCNGTKPCATCAKKSVDCTYTTANVSASASGSGASPTKRPHADISAGLGADTSSSVSSSTRGAIASAAAAASTSTTSTAKPLSRRPTVSRVERASKSRNWGRKKNAPFELEMPFPPPRHLNPHYALPPTQNHPPTAADAITTSSQEEEAVLEHTTRLLKDQTGRMLYIGDSATLSYLHLLRRMVESISGPSDFTTDPSKGNIVENVVDLPLHIRPPSILADRQTANVLVESFFTNTSGLVDIFDRHEFLTQLDACYDKPLSTSNNFLCLLFLTFAIGLVMATPDADTKEYAIVQGLNEKEFDQAELFFRSAKCLCDPLSGLEDADFWSIQALSLISIYMLVVSKRNAAFAYHGMAVRSAIALGLHRKEAMASFKGSELNARRNIWKSLYVLDRFIAASLGRPSAINDDECTGAALEDAFMLHILPIAGHQSRHQQQEQTSPTASYTNPAFKATEAHVLGVNATVRSCRITGNILKKLYARRRVSIRATADVVEQCKAWSKDLHECLRWHHRPSAPSSAGTSLPKKPPRAESIAILHVNLVYCHSVILLTRPFLLFLIHAERPGSNRVRPALRTRTEMFSEVCVAASYHTITMIKSALDDRYLPCRNPFVMYFLFTAALLIMSNEFVALYHHADYEAFAEHAIAVMEYFSRADAQGKRLLWILRALQQDVAAQTRHGAAPASNVMPGTTQRSFKHQFPSYLAHDPIPVFFVGNEASSSWLSSAAKPGGVGASSIQVSGHVDNSASDGLRTTSTQAFHDAQGPAVALSCYQRPDIGQSSSAGAYPQHGSSVIFMPSTDTTSPTAQNQSLSTLRQPHAQPLYHVHAHPHAHTHAQPQINTSYSSDSPSQHPPVLPPPCPGQAHSIPYSPGHGTRGSGAGGSSSLGVGIVFGTGYGGQAAFPGAASGSAPGHVSGYFHPVSEGKSGDPDGSDSMGTDTEGFDLDLLWDWPDNGGPITIATGAVAMAGSGTPMAGSASLESRGGGPAENSNYTAVSVATVVNIPHISNIPSAADAVSAYLVGSERGSGMAAQPSGPLMGAPTNVPLYHTADFG